MGKHQLDIARITDGAILSFFEKAAALIGTSQFRIIEVGIQKSRDVEVGSIEKEPLSGSDLYTIVEGSVRNGTYSLTLTRRLDEGPQFAFDRLAIENTPQQPNQPGSPPDDRLRILNSLIQETFQHQPAQIAKLLPNPKAFSTLMESHQSMIVRLQDATTTMVEQVASARMKLEEEYAERTSALSAEIEKRRSELEEAAQLARQELEQKDAALKARSDALDNRDHIHVRRALSKNITDTIQDRLKGAIVPRGVGYLGFAVLGLTLTASLFLGWVSYFSLQEYAALLDAAAAAAGRVQTSDAMALQQRAVGYETWILLGRGFLAGAVAVAFLVYAISWLKNLYEDRIRAHRALERYSIDINRASWAVETIMEAKRENGVIPDLLVASVARNLFDADGRSSPSGADNGLSTLLRSAARAKFGPGGAEIEVTGRGARKLADELE